MATAIITIRDSEEGGVLVTADFGEGFDGTSPSHLFAVDVVTEMAQEDKPND